MKKCLWFVVLCVSCAVLGIAAGCGDTKVDGPVPIEGTITTEPGGPQVVYNKETCNVNADCGYDELCTLDPSATKAVGYTIQVCVAGCDAELETVDTEVENEDGTSFISTEVVKVAETDTCQRLGDETGFCDLSTHECSKYETPESPVVDPTPEESESVLTEPEGVVEMTSVTCCYDGDVAGLYGQLAWSTSTSADPDSWEAARDLEFNWKGCFNSSVDLGMVTIGFWADVTVGTHEGKAADEVEWKGASMKPSECLVDGEPVSVGPFEPNYGWPLYDAAGD
jgi:hypothetical protein